MNQALFKNAMQGVSKFLNEYQSYLNVFLIFIAITLVIIFVLNAAKLASAGENPRKRQEAIHGILVTGICIAVLGSFSLILGLLIAFIVV
jgi:hypothetical protein